MKNATALFSGGQLSENDKARVLEAIQEAYFEAKIINKNIPRKNIERTTTTKPTIANNRYPNVLKMIHYFVL